MAMQATGRMIGRAYSPLFPAFAALLVGAVIIVGIVVAQRFLVGGSVAPSVSQADQARRALIQQRAGEKQGLSPNWAGSSSYNGTSSLGYGPRQVPGATYVQKGLGATFTPSEIDRALAEQHAREKDPLFPRHDSDVRRGGYLIR
jgi:hypothetical protein